MEGDDKDSRKNKSEKISLKRNNINLNKSIKENDRTLSLDQSIENGDIKIINLENNENINIDYSFKVIVIGNSAVGKSSLVQRGIKNRFLEDYYTTIGFDYSSFYINYDSKIIKLQIWDTCGQEIYQSLITNFYRNSSMAILVYAINDKKSFNNIDNWLKELKTESNPDAKTILIGNKRDLESKREVSYEEAEKYAHDYNFISFFETSAKTGFNVQKVFINTAVCLYEEYIKYKDSENPSTIELNERASSSLKNIKKTNKKKERRECC